MILGRHVSCSRFPRKDLRRHALGYVDVERRVKRAAHVDKKKIEEKKEKGSIN